MKETKSLTKVEGQALQKWRVIDAKGKTLGRLASEVAQAIRGKDKPQFTPHIDCGDSVVVINAEQINLTGKKLEQKFYYRHSGYVGGLKKKSAGELLESHPERLIKFAVKGMLPKNRLGRHLNKKLKICCSDSHPYSAQKPEQMELKYS